MLIILSDLENCKGYESTFISGRCDNHSVQKGRAALIRLSLCTSVRSTNGIHIHSAVPSMNGIYPFISVHSTNGGHPFVGPFVMSY